MKSQGCLGSAWMVINRSSHMYNHDGERQRPNRTNPSPMFTSKKIGVSLEFLHFGLHQKLWHANFYGIL